ncbi:MAG: signal peptide peptidase SppA [Alistipes sp.]|nr:signal peptide peptidase SppA [Alistipes sp.]
MEENKVNEIKAEETQNQNIEPTPAEENVAEQNAVENTTPAEEPAVEPNEEATPATPAAEETPKAEAAPAAPAAKRVVKKAPAKATKTSFGKIFLAALLAVVVGSVLSFVIMMGFFSSVSALMTPKAAAVPESAILKIDFAESIVDLPSSNPMDSFDFMSMSQNSSISLYSTLQALDAAAADERIKGIYINLTGMGGASNAIIEEVRDAIVEFKKSGKWVVAYGDRFTQGQYYLCSVADKVYIQPEGTFEWIGNAGQTLFFKGLIDKLGVDVQILRPTVCKYKSAVEPYFLTEMSPANRQQMQELVDGIWSVVTEAVSASRNISVEELNALADNLSVVLPSEAVEHKLVDGLKYADEMEELFKSEYGIEKPEYVSLGAYAATLTPDLKKLDAPKVAIVYAQGEVLDGEGPENQIYGYSVAKKIRGVAEDDDVKAVVLRVNSPGGSALAADIVWREVKLLQEKKPVIVSMGDYAASGGYYISAPADAIVADKMTLTGSIGVFGMIPSFGDALKDKLGVTIDGVQTNKYAGMGNGFAPLKEGEYQALMRSVDRVYERFTSLVAEGRNLPIERVLELAEGRVWSGTAAQANGLADTNGGLKAAIAIAIDKAELGDNYQIEEVKTPAEGFMAILESLNVKVRQQMTARTELGRLYGEYSRMERLFSGGKGVYAFCPYIYMNE